MTTILIDIEADGEFCGKCDLWERGVHTGDKLCEPFFPHQVGLRHQQCLAAEARATKLLRLEAQVRN